MPEPELEKYERKLREVFDPAQAQFSAILARLSVLFEDLRIEEYGSRLDTLADLDVVKPRDTARSISCGDRSPRSWSSRARSRCSISAPSSVRSRSGPLTTCRNDGTRRRTTSGTGRNTCQIIEQYDHLTAEDIQACLAYAKEVIRSERVYAIKRATRRVASGSADPRAHVSDPCADVPHPPTSLLPSGTC